MVTSKLPTHGLRRSTVTKGRSTGQSSARNLYEIYISQCSGSDPLLSVANISVFSVDMLTYLTGCFTCMESGSVPVQPRHRWRGQDIRNSTSDTRHQTFETGARLGEKASTKHVALFGPGPNIYREMLPVRVVSGRHRRVSGEGRLRVSEQREAVKIRRRMHMPTGHQTPRSRRKLDVSCAKRGE